MSTKSELAIQKKKQTDALADMTPALRSVYKKIQAKTQAMEKGVVLAMYEVGELVKEVTANERKYGEAAVPALAVALGKQWSANQLWDYRQLANAFTRTQIEKLLEQRTRGGNTITITHLKKLSGLTAAKRKTMTRRVFEEDLTTDELAMAIQGPGKSGKRSVGGRKISPPKTIHKGLMDIADYAEAVDKRIKIWDTHVFGKIAKASPDDCDSDLLKQLQATRKAEEETVANSQHLIGQLDKAIKRVETVMAKRKSGSNGAAQQTTKKKATTAKRGPGRPPGSKTKKKATSAKDKIAAAKKRRASRPQPA